MTQILNAVASRIKYLAVCLNSGVDRDATMKVAEQSKTAILKMVSIILGNYPWTLRVL